MRVTFDHDDRDAGARAQCAASGRRARAARGRCRAGVPRPVRRPREDLPVSDSQRSVRQPVRARVRVARAPAAGSSRRCTRRPELLEGTHDFAAFQSVGSDTSGVGQDHSRVRTFGWTRRLPRRPVLQRRRERSSDLLVYEVRGDGFLRHMVRTIVGTLVEVGRGWREPGVDRGIAAIRAARTGGRRRPRPRGSSSSGWTMIEALHPQGLRRGA